MRRLSGFFAVALLAMSAVLLAETSLAQEAGWGHLKGTITVVGEVPEPEALPVDRDEAFCLADGEDILDRSLIVGENGGLQDAFVMMYFARTDPRPEVHPSYEETAGDKVVIDNKNCMFEPQSLFLRTSQILVMKNSDEVGHNCHVTLFQPENEQNANIPAFDEVEAQCPRPEKTPGVIKCDIHKWMKASILVRDEPYAAVTDADGNFLIQNVPAGKWKFQFWHVRSGYMRDLKSEGDDGFKLGRRGEIELEIKSGETLDLGKLVFPVDEF